MHIVSFIHLIDKYDSIPCFIMYLIMMIIIHVILDTFTMLKNECKDLYLPRGLTFHVDVLSYKIIFYILGMRT